MWIRVAELECGTPLDVGTWMRNAKLFTEDAELRKGAEFHQALIRTQMTVTVNCKFWNILAQMSQVRSVGSNLSLASAICDMWRKCFRTICGTYVLSPMSSFSRLEMQYLNSFCSVFTAIQIYSNNDSIVS